jgi:CBS domain-containing protein
MDAIVNFLKECTGFHTLPKTKLVSLAKNLNLEYFPKGSRIMVEDQTKVQNVLLIEIGALQLSWESKSLHDLEKVVLERGDVFGGISILLNNSVSIRTVTAVKDCFIYLLPKRTFFEFARKIQNYKMNSRIFLEKELPSNSSKTTKTDIGNVFKK